MKRTNLFQIGHVQLNSGPSEYKIECDALTDADWWCLAYLLALRLPAFSAVDGVPTGGLRLADAISEFIQPGGALLIVDDVFTTGASITRHRGDRDAIGAVVFARNPTPPWITPLFRMTPDRRSI